LVAIEGIDGSGKGTQATLLRDALTNEGVSCGLIAFPRYDATTFGRTIARYLNGEFGELATVGPHFAALLYAGDRFESLPLIQSEMESRDVLIFDRYVPSNIAHQAAKLPAAEREPFIAWVEAIEYGVYRLPRPDVIIWLDMPVATAQELIARKPKRRYTAKAADLHEADGEYLTQTAEVYRQVAMSDRSWHVISCCEGSMLRAADSLNHEILVGVVRPTLSNRQIGNRFD
jgi:dTMP kinase